MAQPTHLRVEHLTESLGITVSEPRLSWRLPEGAAVQRGYQIEVDGRSSELVTSAHSQLVPWPSAPLLSRQQVSWRVRVSTDLGRSEWSEPCAIEAGLLLPSDWHGRWIGPVEGERAQPGSRPGYVLRRAFALSATGEARMYATAHGIYETFLNGRRVGDLELTPGFTAYDVNLQFQTYDVTELLRAGSNVWDVVLSDGWYRGRTGFTQVADCYGDDVAFLGQLHVGETVISSDDEWMWSTGSVVSADLMAGQAVDLRCTPDHWRPVAVTSREVGRLVSSPSPPARRVQEIRPVAVTHPMLDRHVVDLGQNINGWVRLSDLGPEGTAITLTHGEALDHAGDVTQEHLAAFDFFTQAPIAVGQIDSVVSSGRAGEQFEPRHTTHGFQYVRVDGHPGPLSPDDVTGVVVHSDLRRTGWFRCSDERINKFHDITVWSFRGNACEVPTDCPQRERAGWTGDYQVFIPSATFLFDVAGFSVKWLRDLMADARPDGCVPNFAPDPARPKALPVRHPTWMMMQGSSGWGDAITIVPWELHRAYGDDGVLAETWPAMLAWVEFAASAARNGRHPTRIERSPTPAPREEFIWDTGFHWGEWLEPGVDGTDEDWGRDKGDIGTAFLHRSASIAARTARLLGHHEQADRLETLAQHARDAWQAEFIRDGALTPDTQANHVRALAFGLVPDERRAAVVRRLVELIRDAGTHLGTGFLATPHILPVLADHDELDLAYELLLQDSPPSWLYMVERGATTVWESWEGLAPDGTPHSSLNHYSKGAVIAFLHSHVAGLRPLDDGPGYRRFRVEPRPGGGLTWAEATHDSPYGRIAVSWRIDGGDFVLLVTVPPGTTADIVLPDGTRSTADVGVAELRCPYNR